MVINLIELAKSYLTDGMISQVGSMLGESQSNTKKAFDGILSAIMGGIVQKSSEPGGTSAIMDLIGEVMTPNRAAGEVITPAAGILGQLSHLLANSDQSGNFLLMGASFIQRIFGEKATALTNGVAAYSAVKQASASTMMNIAAPVLFSLLGQKIADDDTGIPGLATLLKSQTNYVESEFPSGLGSILASIPGLGFLNNLTSKADNLSSTIRESVTRPIAPDPIYTDDEPSSGGNRWLPWLLLALGALALFFILRSCNTDQKPVESTTEAVIDSTSSTMSAAADSAEVTLDSAAQAFKDATAKLGAFFKRKLPSGIELNIPELGVENKLVQFIEDKSKPVDKTTWFNFDRLLFDTGKSTLRPESQEQLTNIATILKEYPNVHIKLGGYTDNTGSAAINKKLSQERADSVMSELVKLGIDKSRLEAEGYGPEHPVASNDTPEGRAENRRIAIRVTQK
ncbi:OmpA family protein [Spirosoma gilvum]